MAKSPDSRKGKDPARPTRAKAAREPLAPITPHLEKLLNPAIEKGTAGVGSQTGRSQSGLKPPPDNSFDRRADFAAARAFAREAAQPRHCEGNRGCRFADRIGRAREAEAARRTIAR